MMKRFWTEKNIKTDEKEKEKQSDFKWRYDHRSGICNLRTKQIGLLSMYGSNGRALQR